MTQITLNSLKGTDFLNAKQASAYLQIHEKTLYRLVREARIPALKLGREWRFKKSLLDEWLTKRMKVESGQPEWMWDLLKEWKEALSQVYGQRLRRVYLYGSAARGEMRRGSDLDVAVVLESLQNRWEEIQRVSRHRAEISLRYGVTVSLHFMSEEELRVGQSPLIENIRREGIAA